MLGRPLEARSPEMRDDRGEAAGDKLGRHVASARGKRGQDHNDAGERAGSESPQLVRDRGARSRDQAGDIDVSIRVYHAGGLGRDAGGPLRQN